MLCVTKRNQITRQRVTPAQTPLDNQWSPPRRSQRKTRDLGLYSILTVLPDLLRPVRTEGEEDVFVVISFIIDLELFRGIFKVSPFFIGSLKEINFLMTLFRQMEVSIVTIVDALGHSRLNRGFLIQLGNHRNRG